jgi:localization factor PodJL
MASTELDQHIRQGVDALRSDDGHDPAAGCHAGDLKGLLNSIVDQISEADRRHSDTLQQLQDRLTGIGREAKAIKPRVPDSFAAAFERIEAGLAELASRITETSNITAPSLDHAFAAASPHAHAVQADKHAFVDPPVALRSASDQSQAAPRRRDEEMSRMHSGVDTFDVIESTPPAAGTDPWDRDAAEALTGLYESGLTGLSPKQAMYSAPQADMHAVGTPASGQPGGAAVPGVDAAWLESRFSEISKRIDESLADIRPDQGFFSLGQRIDQLEQHFSGLIEGVATRNDVEGVRLIEAHVSELAGHLENAHHQLMRLDLIEDQLAHIAARLEDVHSAAEAASNGDGSALHHAPDIDIHSVARTAAEAAAAHVAALPPQVSDDAVQMREMLSTFIAESRQGEENTTALLDTLQQAMIRLLDRVDSMELNSLHRATAQTQSIPREFAREQPHFGTETSKQSAPAYFDAGPGDALDAAVAAVASARTTPVAAVPMSGDVESAGSMAAHDALRLDAAPQRPQSKLRQDFVADARRAKMRLAAESDAGSITLAKPELEIPDAAPPSKPAPRGGKGSQKSAEKSAKPEGSSLLTPRLRVMALTALLAMSGGWYAMKVLHKSTAAVATMADPSAASAGQAAPSLGNAAAKNAKLDTPRAAGADSEASQPELTPEQTEAPAAGDASQLNLHNDTHGEIVTDELTVGSTSVPLYGVAVDSEKTMTAAEVARAKRQQAIAAVSTELGQAAAQNPAAVAMPASLQLNDGAAPGQTAEGGQTSLAKSGMSQSSALDLPSATVGPLSLRLAAANGDASAQFEVGARLAEGKGTNQNFKDAAKWYQRSASQGFAQAQYRLGTLYERGLGLKPDLARAADWYKRAAEQGNIKAMHNLAVLSANQSKGSPDYATAAQWFQKAAEFGLSDSQFNLAVLHENGLGVTQDLTLAYKWLALAAKSGDKEAIRRRDILQGKLTAEQMTKAEGLVAEWKVKMADQYVNDPRKAGEAWKSNPANGVSG